MTVARQLSIVDFTGDESGPTRDLPLLVLGPSLGTTVRNLWGAAAAKLTGRFHVLGWDLPGHGTGRPAGRLDIAGLAQAVLAITDREFHYAGDSIGGAVGLQLLLDAADRVRSATLVCTGARIGDAAMWHERAAAVRAHGTGALLDMARARWFGPGFTQHEPAVADALLDDLRHTDPTSYAAACEALARFDVRDRLAEITAPVLAIAGEVDRVTPTASLRQIAGGVQHGRLETIPGTAHLAPAEEPGLVAGLVAANTAAEVTATGTAQVRAEGMRVRREVLGDAHVDGATAQTTEFTADFQELITRYAWGEIWTRRGLDHRSRSLITLSALVALGHHDELAMHVRAARTNGLTSDEIKELLLLTAIYCGVPAANTAFRIAQRALTAEESTTTEG